MGRYGDVELIVALDPGGTTGMAFLKDGEYGTDSTKDMYKVLDTLRRLAKDIDYVVIEDFNTSGKINKHGLHTVRLVGAVEGLCWHLGLTCVVRMPSSRYQGFGRAKYMAAKGASVHEIDALAHLIAFESEMDDENLRTKNDNMALQNRAHPASKGRKFRRGSK